jgi:hypothetical protein
LKITVFDSDIGEELGMKTVVQEKRGVKQYVDVFFQKGFHFSFFSIIIAKFWECENY